MMAEICLTSWDRPTLMIIGIKVLIFTKIQQCLEKIGLSLVMLVFYL